MDFDMLLQQWGETQRITDEVAEEIRLSIVDEMAITPDWWTNFNAQFVQNVMMSVQPFSMAA